jgi:hypothetical protein
MKDVFTASEFLKDLTEGSLVEPITKEGTLKLDPSDPHTFLFSEGMFPSCGPWSKIPVEVVESVTLLSMARCQDHEHPFVRLQFKEPPKDNTLATFYAGLARRSSPQLQPPTWAQPGLNPQAFSAVKPWDNVCMTFCIYANGRPYETLPVCAPSPDLVITTLNQILAVLARTVPGTTFTYTLGACPSDSLRSLMPTQPGLCSPGGLRALAAEPSVNPRRGPGGIAVTGYHFPPNQTVRVTAVKYDPPSGTDSQPVWVGADGSFNVTLAPACDGTLNANVWVTVTYVPAGSGVSTNTPAQPVSC